MTRHPLGVHCSIGDASDFLALSHHHYRPSLPATCVHTLTARHRASPDPVGVLLVSMPVLNATWRDVVFPREGNLQPTPRYRSGDRRADAHLLNQEVRTISRLVVDPRFRGLGIGAGLVRQYLAAPLTIVTEAAAAMGACLPFFTAAGMTEYTLPPPPDDLRLADTLAHLRVRPWMLGDPSRLPENILGSPLLERELRRWAQASRGRRGLIGQGIVAMLRVASRVFFPPRVYVAVSKGGSAR